jgi:lipid-A-disaccharide synthase
MAAEDLLIVAGEASGDLHASRLLAELKGFIPELRPFGLGDEQLLAAGLDPVGRSGEISVVGITEALRVLPRARELFSRLLAEVDRRGATAAVLVDFPEFNLRLARELKERGVKVIYYISPQVWAWRRGRVKTVAEVVDKMLVVFPFEVDFYRRHGVDVVHVGHPLVDEVPQLPHIWDRGVPVDRPYQVALLPGSRLSEIEALLPNLVEAGRQLAEELPVYFRLVQAPTVPREVLEEEVALSGLPMRVVAEDRFDLLAESHLALTASGTATLELGLLGTPMIVLYRLAGWTYVLARVLVRLPYFSLVNLVLEREVVPELLQGQARPERIRHLAAALLRDPERTAEMRRGLGELRPRLGEGGASRRAAWEVAIQLGSEVPA